MPSSLCDYEMDSQRKCRVIQKLLVKSLARQEVDLLREVFNLFDVEKKGYVSLEDFRRMISSFGCTPSDKELEAIFKDHDMDGDGKVSFYDMVYANTRNRDQKDYRDEIVKAFHRYDKDLNNVLDLNELQRVLTSLDGLEKMSLLEVKEIMNDFDFNGDGVISASEFLKYLVH